MVQAHSNVVQFANFGPFSSWRSNRLTLALETIFRNFFPKTDRQ